MPQLFGSVAVFAHVMPPPNVGHIVDDAEHMHAPIEHVAPVPQAFPHVPQLLTSFWKFTH
jgi:hypothetical protein